MPNHRFSENHDIRLIVGTTYVDVSGFERVVFYRLGGASGNAIQLKQALTSGGGSAKDITGAAISVAGDQSGRLNGVELETRKLDLNTGDWKWVSPNIAGSVIFIGYRGGNRPYTLDSTVSVVYCDG